MHWVKLHSDPHTGADGGHIDSATATAAKIVWSIVTRPKKDHRKARVKLSGGPTGSAPRRTRKK